MSVLMKKIIINMGRTQRKRIRKKNICQEEEKKGRKFS
jgi:hypothetical protein